MDTVGLSGVVTSSSSSGQTLQATSAVSAPAASTSDSTTSSATDSSVYYSSPIIAMDPATGEVVWNYRDTKTGEFLYQSPSSATLQYERAQKLAESRQASQNSTLANQTSQGQPGRTVSIYG